MSLTRGLQLSAVTALAVLTAVLVVLAMTRTVAAPGAPADLDPTSVTLGGAGGGADASAGSTSTVVSVLGDEHVLREGSWFYRSVPAEPSPRMTRGVVLAQPDATAESLESDLGQVAPGDVVMIAAGSVDVRNGTQPMDVYRDLRALAQGVGDRGGYPVLTLLPPSDTSTFKTKVVNRRLREYAAKRDVALLDVHTPVATPEGKWRKKFTDDGEFANEAGRIRQAEAIAPTLPWLLASVPG